MVPDNGYFSLFTSVSFANNLGLCESTSSHKPKLLAKLIGVNHEKEPLSGITLERQLDECLINPALEEIKY